MNTDLGLLPKVEYEIAQHKNEAAIFILFDYDAALTARVKKLVGVKWSQSRKAWYVRDTEQYRQKFGLALKPIGADALPKIDPANQAAFTAYIETLQLKAYSKSTINTYRNEFSQLLLTLKSHKVDDLTPDRLRSYFLYCVNTLRLSENTLDGFAKSQKKSSASPRIFSGTSQSRRTLAPILERQQPNDRKTQHISSLRTK